MVRPSRRGTTLLELVLVMAILVLVASLGYPAYETLVEGVKTDTAVDAVRGALADAQAHAMNEGQAYRFAIVPGQRDIRIAPDSSDYWSGGGTPAQSSNDNTDPPLAYGSKLPAGMAINIGSDAVAGTSGTETEKDSAANKDSSANLDPAAYTSAAVLLPDGSARDDVDLAMSRNGVRVVVIHLRALTGSVTVQNVQNGG